MTPATKGCEGQRSGREAGIKNVHRSYIRASKPGAAVSCRWTAEVAMPCTCSTNTYLVSQGKGIWWALRPPCRGLPRGALGN